MAKELDQPSKRICIGKITGAHGVKGLVKIHPFCEDPELIEQVSDFEITIKSITAKHILADIKDINDKEAADTLRGTELFIARDQLPEIEDDGEYYIEDLIGMTAVNENGEMVGKIKAVLNFGAGELLEIRLKNGQELLVPFTDQYVPDIADKVIIRDYESLMI